MSVGGWRRWFRFNAVGAVGILVQLASLSFLTAFCGVHYLVATLVAVEVAIVHNFLWHERWTWSDRRTAGAIRRLMRFNLTTGLVSLVGNVALMPLLVRLFGLGVLPANMVAIGVCSVANFVLADRVAFAKQSCERVAFQSRARSGVQDALQSRARSEAQDALQSRARSGGARFLSPGAE